MTILSETNDRRTRCPPSGGKWGHDATGNPRIEIPACRKSAATVEKQLLPTSMQEAQRIASAKVDAP